MNLNGELSILKIINNVDMDLLEKDAGKKKANQKKIFNLFDLI